MIFIVSKNQNEVLMTSNFSDAPVLTIKKTNTERFFPMKKFLQCIPY